MLRPERALRAADVLAWLERAFQEHGAPAFLRRDNGPEFIAQEVQRWLADNHIKTIYIDPGSPWQNGFVESCHGRFRDECLQPGATLDPHRGTRGRIRLPPVLQPRSPARQARLRQPGTLRGAEPTSDLPSWTLDKTTNPHVTNRPSPWANSPSGSERWFSSDVIQYSRAFALGYNHVTIAN